MTRNSTSPGVDVFLSLTRDLVGVALRSIAPEGLTVPQFRLLLVLHENGSTSSVKVARLLDVVPSSVTRMAHRLATAELIDRNHVPEHRGIVALSLTPKGAAVVDRAIRRRHHELSGVLESLAPETRSAAIDAMAAIHDLLGADDHMGGVVL